jgi:nitrous oxidase accessory protein
MARAQRQDGSVIVAALAIVASVQCAGALQKCVDAAPAGATVRVAPGTHLGDVVIARPLHLVGVKQPLLIGSGAGTVIQIRAAGVIVEGLDIDGRGGGDLGDDPSGIHVAAKNAVIRGCRIRNTLFGVYLREADGVLVDRCMIRGIPGKDPGEKGSGIHVFDTNGFTLRDNDIADVRDGLYIQSSSHGEIVRNHARDLRYGLHYMYSDDNRFEDNTFENGAAGTTLMYSRRIVFRRNRFIHNRGFASVGLLFKTCDDVVAEDNLIADNARGIFLEGSSRNVFRRNVIAESDTALVIYDSCSTNRFEGNSFVANLTPLTLAGRRTDTVFRGNYWSDNAEPDLDGDGRSDRPYRVSNVFDHMRGNLTAADLFAQGIGARAMAIAEEAFPVLDPIPVLDPAPLVRPPRLDRVPRIERSARGADAFGVAASVALLLGGAALLIVARMA